MKFLHVYCENRKADVYISLDKIVLIQKTEEGSLIEMDGGGEVVNVTISSDDLVRKINGEDRAGIGFRTGG